MNDFESKANRVVELLEGMAKAQAEMVIRQRQLFRIYAWSAGLIWLMIGSIFAAMAYAFFF